MQILGWPQVGPTACYCTAAGISGGWFHRFQAAHHYVVRTSMSSLLVKLLPSNYLTNKRVMLLERNREWHITVS